MKSMEVSNETQNAATNISTLDVKASLFFLIHLSLGELCCFQTLSDLELIGYNSQFSTIWLFFINNRLMGYHLNLLAGFSNYKNTHDNTKIFKDDGISNL